MLPYVLDAGHVNHARLRLYYLRTMEAMPKLCQEQFLLENMSCVMSQGSGMVFGAICSLRQSSCVTGMANEALLVRH